MSVGDHLFLHRLPPGAAKRGTGQEGLRSRRRSSSREERIFAGCLVIIALHLAVVTLVLPDRGSALLRVGPLLGLAVGLAVVGALFVISARGLRVLVAALIGLGTTVVGLATSVPHAALTGLDGADVTGILATVAGIALVALAFWIALRGRRLAVKLAVAIPACIVIAQWLIAPAINAGVATHAARPAVASARTLGLPGARDVTFAARDGTRLSGWYVPGRSGAAVILLHGSHGTRTETVAHLRMLAASGYGVLAFDARGHGLSSGHTNALGWSGTDDIAGAVSFLGHQAGVDPRRVAALGLSMGAEEALRAAATGIPLRAVVADGAGASTLGDEQIVGHGLAPVFASETWLTMRAIELLSDKSEPPPLKTIVRGIRVPVLLIASGASSERTIDDAYQRRIGSNATLWYLHDVGHTNSLATHPEAYAARVTAFFKAALATR